MRVRSMLGSLGALAFTTVMACAETATPDQAHAIRAALERYTGQGEAGISPVAVTPEGDHYLIAVDLKRALHGLESFGVTLDVTPYTLSATPLAGGTWHVTSADVPRVTARHGENSYSVVMNGAAFDGVFNPALPAFQSSSLTYESMSIAAVGRQDSTQTREIHRGKQTSTATPAGPGAANVQIAQSNAGFTQDIALDVPKAGAAPARKLSIESDGTSATASFDNMRVHALTELWAFFVAHPSVEAVKASQTELRDLLRQALPLFDHWTQGGSAEHFAVDSAFGPFAAQSIGGTIGLSGLVDQGKVETAIRFDGLSLPDDLLPAWTEGLLPVSADIGQSLTGFHLDEAARDAVESFDLSAKDAISEATIEKMRVALGPPEQMVVTIAPSRVTSRLLELRFDGEVRLRQPLPEMRVTIHATGLDKAIQDIQGKAAGDKNAAQLIAVLVLAKGLGKAEPDGSLSWVVTNASGSTITVNGLTFPGMEK